MKLRQQESQFFFKPKDAKFYWFTIPMVFFFLLGVAVFIATSFWSIDLKGAEVFAKGMKYQGVIYWSQYYSASGNTQLMVVLIILCMVIIETLYMLKRKRKQKRGQLIGKYESWTIWIIYGVILAVWLIFNIWQAVHMSTEDKGFGPGFDNEVMGSFKYKQTGKIICTVLQTFYLVIGFWWLRFVMVKRKDFWFQQYWLDATKGLVFFALSYLVVAIIKWGFGRTYYYNYEFGTLLNELNDPHSSIYNPEAYQHYINVGHIDFQWGYGINHDQNAPGPIPWWKTQGAFLHPKTDPQFGLPVQYSFPSGHINAEFCCAAILFLLIGGKEQNRKFNWWKKIIYILVVLRLIAMNFAVVVMRWHWFSDTSFTVAWAILAFPLANIITVACYNSIDRKVVNYYANKYPSTKFAGRRISSLDDQSK